MLHTLHRSPWLTDFAALLRLLSEGDELLLLQDGVTAAVDGNRYLEGLCPERRPYCPRFDWSNFERHHSH